MSRAERRARRRAVRQLDDLSRYYSGRPSRRAENVGCLMAFLTFTFWVTVAYIAFHFISRAW